MKMCTFPFVCCFNALFRETLFQDRFEEKHTADQEIHHRGDYYYSSVSPVSAPIWLVMQRGKKLCLEGLFDTHLGLGREQSLFLQL